MIIFGFKSYATLLATMTLVCPQCHNPAAHRLHRLVNKFTLFFIPLFPVSTKHVIDCTFCGLRRTPSRGEAEQLQKYATAQQADAQPHYGTAPGAVGRSPAQDPSQPYQQ